MNESYKQLLKEIRIRRHLKDISQAKMAEYMNISQSAYGQMENGKISLSIERLKQIGEILDISMYDILRYSDFEDITAKNLVETSKQYKEELEKREKFFKNIESMIHVLGEKINECLNQYAPGNQELYKKMEQLAERYQDLLNAIDIYKIGLK
ncbi:MAG TPA: helix-turn-helix domain-containing protein [Bacteroidales bacterium]|nr:helix-turn-helix domain-containing protein [Bacteroidales bacterium]